MTQTKIGGEETTAYEILKNLSDDNSKDFSYNYKADLWSIGIVFY